MLLTRDEYIECIRLSGLIDETRLSRFLEGAIAREADVLEIGRACVETGMLTDWQRERLLEKKWRGFFIGKYKILSPLGAGAMGSVFLAEHKVMRQRVALKVLARRLASRPANVTRFEREARAAAVVCHPNVVRAYDIDREGDTHYLVMEYVQGENLQKIVQSEGPLDPLIAANYIAQIARGLNEAHKNGMIHRDIKPSNVLLDLSGVVKILDLGLARLQEDEAYSLTVANDTKMIGTVDYLAPEQAINSHTIDGRADIYSLGCSLYYLLTGVPPFPTGSLTERILKHQSRRPLDIRKRRPGVPDALVNICSRMLEKQPSKRYQTGDEAADALQAFYEGRMDALVIHETNRSVEDSDSGINSLAEDSSAGRIGIGGNSTAKKSMASKSSVSKTNGTNVPSSSRSSVNQKCNPASISQQLNDSLANAKNSASNVQAHALDNEFELTPVEMPSPPTLESLSTLDNLPALRQGKTKAYVNTNSSLGGEIEVSATANPPSLLDTVSLAENTLTNKSTLNASFSQMSSATNLALTNAMHELDEEEQGFNYSLWILIASGLIISVILGVVGFSYINSFKKVESNKFNLEGKPF